MANKIRMIPDNWTYGDYFKFLKAFQSGNNSETFRYAQKLIMSWDYSVDLSLDNAIMKLGVSESAEVIRTVFETLSKYIDDLDISEVEVSFDAWTTEQFFQFDEWKREGKFEKTERALRDVILWEKLDKAPPNEPLSFTIAAVCYQAISKAYEKVVAGKN